MKKANFGYIGSKFSLLDFIKDSIEDLIEDTVMGKEITDIFAGTGIVGLYMKTLGASVTSNDMEYFSYINNYVTIYKGEQPEFNNFNSIEDAFDFYNNAKPFDGFMYKKYSPSGKNEYDRKYFTVENARKIDGIRKCIEETYLEGKIEKFEYFYLILSLVVSVTKISNTAAVYEAYLKAIKPAAKKPLILRPLEIIANHKKNKYEVFNEDANNLIDRISGDVLYLDPPYNSRQYSSNYHILNTIAKNDKPVIKGKTGNRVDNFKSPWSQKTNAAKALDELARNANFKYLVMSYNDEGIIPIEKIEEIFNKYGTYKQYKKNYRRFKAGKRDYKQEGTVEYLHCCIKNDKK